MLILDYAAGAVIRIVTTSAADIEAQVSGVDHTISGDVFLAFDQNTAIAAATTTTIGAGPASGHVRNYKRISLRNKHAATANTLTIEHYDGTLAVQIDKVTLAAGEQWLMDEKGVIFQYDSNGAVKTAGQPAASDTASGIIELATQAEMEAATDVARAVTPGRQHFHPSACKGWGKAAGAGTLTTGYNMDACTDTGPGNLGVNITTDISSADYAIVTGTTAVATTLTVATIDNGAIVYNASQAAGAFALWNFDHTATTHVVQDPQSYFWAIFGDFA